MKLGLVILGIILTVFGIYAHSAELTGSCYATATQCELALSNLQLCNTSDVQQTYLLSAESPPGAGFNAIPDEATLDGGNCTDLRIFSAAECYAAPGKYTGKIIVDFGSERITKTCTLEVKQGHLVNLVLAPKEQTATQCEEKAFDITLHNNSSVPLQRTERAQISVTGLPQGWYSLERELADVQLGSAEHARLVVKAPCDVPLGSYEFSVKAALQNNDFYSESKGVFTIAQGQKLTATIPPESSSAGFGACQEEKSTGTITIANSGKQQDTFRLSLEGPGFGTLGIDRVTLAAGKQAQVPINFAPANGKGGKYDFTLKMQGTAFDYSTTVPFRANMQDCYGAQVQKLSGNEKVCAEEIPLYKFSVTNDRAKPIELKATLRGMNGQLDASRFTLAPGAQKQLTAALDAKGLAKEGSSERTDIAIELLLDTSKSMGEKGGAVEKIETEKQEITAMINSISGIDAGLREFGQGRECEDSVLLKRIEKLDIPFLSQKIAALSPSGKTPLAQALSSAVPDFPAGKRKAVIIVSDGKETCDGDISKASKELAANNIAVYAIGFAIDKEGREQLKSAAAATKGAYFDAQNAQDLAQVLQQISKQLDITPGKAGKGSFTLLLESEHFSYEKDFQLEASDCGKAAMALPQFYLCPGVAKQDTLTIANLGTQKQNFKMSYSPAWISGPANISVEPNSTASAKILASTPEKASDSKISVRAVSEKVDLSQDSPLAYLSRDACFAIDLIVPSSQLDANAIVGIKQPLFIENRGAIAQEVRLSADKPYVRIADPVTIVESGERKEVDFFVTAPSDLTATQTITFEAHTDRGFSTKASVKLLVPGLKPSEANFNPDLKVGSVSAIKPKDGNYALLVQFELTNAAATKHITIISRGVETKDYNATVSLENTELDAGKSTKGTLRINLPQGFAQKKVVVPIMIETSAGTFTRNIEFDYNNTAADGNAAAPAKANSNPAIGTGLFSLSNLSTGVLAGLVVVVILLIAYSAYRSVQNEMAPPVQPQSPEPAAQPAAAEAAGEAKAKPKKAAAKPKKKPAKKSK